MIANARTSRPLGSPATTRIPASMTTTETAVPRSGSTRIRMQARPATRPSGLPSSVSDSGCRRFRASQAATQTASASLASSEGWKANGPSGTQRRAPLTLWPTSSTPARSTRLTTTKLGAILPPEGVRRPRGEQQRDEAEPGEERLAQEVLHRTAVAAVDRARRRGAVDHHEPERGQRERDQDQDVRLELGSLHPSRFCTRRRNSSPRCTKSRNWSKLAQAGESRTTSPGRASAAASATAASRSPTSTAREPSDACDLLGSLSDQVDRAHVRP